MEFNQLILEKLTPVFKKHNLSITTQFKNYVKVKSGKVVIVISHDERDKSNAFYIGKDENSLYPFEEGIAKNNFSFDLKLNNVTPEVFINSLSLFLKGNGESLLDGDKNILNVIEKYVYKISGDYTIDLINKQNLEEADKAWEEKKYSDFIKYFDKLNRSDLPSSYQQKYKLACKKLINKE